MANKNAEVAVVRNYTSRVGNFNIAVVDGLININNGDTEIALPNGAVGRAILTEALGFVTETAPAKRTAKGKNAGTPRKRRTKAEMEAARAAEANGSAPTATVGNTVGETEEDLEVA